MNWQDELDRITDQIRRRAAELDKLTDGGLVAATGGFFVLGLVTGGVFWIPFGMTGALSAYRLVRWSIIRRSRSRQEALGLVERIKAVKEELFKSQLPDDEKRKLSASLDALLSPAGPATPGIPPPGEQPKLPKSK